MMSETLNIIVPAPTPGMTGMIPLRKGHYCPEYRTLFKWNHGSWQRTERFQRITKYLCILQFFATAKSGGYNHEHTLSSMADFSSMALCFCQELQVQLVNLLLVHLRASCLHFTSPLHYVRYTTNCFVSRTRQIARQPLVCTYIY